MGKTYVSNTSLTNQTEVNPVTNFDVDTTPIGTHEDAADILGRFFRAREQRRR